MVQKYTHFQLLGRGPEIVSPPHFGYDFSNQEKGLSCYITISDQIKDFMNFQINLPQTFYN